MKKEIESLPTEGKKIKLRIESTIYQPMTPKQAEPAYEYEDDDGEAPYDIEDAAIKYLDSKENAVPSDTQHLVQNLTADFAEVSGRVTVTYDDSEMLGMPKTLTQVTFRRDEPTSVAIVRTGAVDSMFVLEAGSRHVCEYKIAGGLALSIAFFAHRVENTVENGVGEIFLDYAVEMGGADTQRTKMKITLSEFPPEE